MRNSRRWRSWRVRRGLSHGAVASERPKKHISETLVAATFLFRTSTDLFNSATSAIHTVAIVRKVNASALVTIPSSSNSLDPLPSSPRPPVPAPSTRNQPHHPPSRPPHTNRLRHFRVLEAPLYLPTTRRKSTVLLSTAAHL